MIELGYYKIRGGNKRQKNWMIYGEINQENNIKIYIQDYKKKGELIMAFDAPYGVGDGGYWIMFTLKSIKETKELLEDVKGFLSSRYKSLRWFMNNDALDKLFVGYRLIKSG